MSFREFLDRLWQTLLEAWNESLQPPTNSAPTIGPKHRQPVAVVGPTIATVGGHYDHQNSTADPLVIGPSDPIIVEPPQRPAWDERGWKRRMLNGTTAYDGKYRVGKSDGRQLSFPGHIRVTDRVPVAYIADPPPDIKRHAKGPCFQLAQPPWFRVHWHRPPRNVDDALLYVERILDEAVR